MRLIAILATFALAACASSHPIEPRLAPPSVDFVGADVERVELANFDFTPNQIRLHAGRPYELVLANLASGGHNFMAPEFFAGAQVRPADVHLVTRGGVEVPAGETRTVHLVPAGGRYKLVCTHTGHALLGMTGTIVVE